MGSVGNLKMGERKRGREGRVKRTLSLWRQVRAQLKQVPIFSRTKLTQSLVLVKAALLKLF